jgi:hypothetical protein
MTGVADYVSGSLELDAGAFVDSLGLKVVLETAETPIADVILVEMFSGWAEPFNDEFVRNTIFEHLVDLLSEFVRQARNLPVPAGVGLRGAKVMGEVIDAKPFTDIARVQVEGQTRWRVPLPTSFNRHFAPLLCIGPQTL